MTSRQILITGGAGFIGSHVVRRLVNHYPDYLIVNLDALTYSGNLENLKDIEQAPNYRFVKGRIEDENQISQLFDSYEFDGVIHMAAESHVDRSIEDPFVFARTNIMGTMVLLNAFRERCAEDARNMRFYHISTDEVYGSLEETGTFNEDSPYRPNSPYAASKASADHFVRAYGKTYNIPFVISNCSNNYGPNQFPEKFIPLCIQNVMNMRPIPIYGSGDNIRDWLYVKDHAEAIDRVFHQGQLGATYNIGGANEWKNKDVVLLICEIMDDKLGRPPGESAKLISYVKDRPGHDFRYAIDLSKIENELQWHPKTEFREGLANTIDWYIENADWLKHVTSGSYQEYYQRMYEQD